MHPQDKPKMNAFLGWSRKKAKTGQVLFVLFWTLFLCFGCEEGLFQIEIQLAQKQDFQQVKTLFFEATGNILEKPVSVEIDFSSNSVELPLLTLKKQSDTLKISIQGWDEKKQVIAKGSMEIRITEPFLKRSFFILLSKVNEVSVYSKKGGKEDLRLSDGLVGHSLVALPNGHVLISGGIDKIFQEEGVFTIPFSKETNDLPKKQYWFSPFSDEIQSVVSLALGRAFHTKTELKNGKVLFLGGGSWFQNSQQQDIFVGIGPIHLLQVDLTATQYFSLGSDFPEIRTSAPVSLESPRLLHTATLLGEEQVLVVGGLQQLAVGNSVQTAFYSGQSVRGIELLDFQNNSPTVKKIIDLSPNQTRYLHQTSQLSKGLFLISGGLDVDGTAKDEESSRIVRSHLFLKKTGEVWGLQDLEGQGQKRFDHASLVLEKEGKFWVLLSGGKNERFEALSNVEVWDETGLVSSLEPFENARYGHSMHLLSNQKILVVGGQGKTKQSVLACEVFSWSVSAGKIQWKRDTVEKCLLSQGRYRFPSVIESQNQRTFFFGGGDVSANHLWQGFKSIEFFTPPVSQ